MENKLTVLDCVVKLLDFFSKETVFYLSKDYRSVLGVTANDDKEDKALVELALKELEDNGSIRQSIINKDKVFFLRKPLENIEQQIILSHVSAKSISEKINFYCKFFNNDRDYCNPFSVKEKDILNLINIIIYLEQKTKENKLTSE